MRTPTLSIIALPCLFTILCTGYAVAQEPLVTQPRRITPAQYLQGDTLRSPDRWAAPGDGVYPYTPEQDSAFVRAMRTPVSAAQRFAHEARTLAELMRFSRAFQRQPSPWELAMKNMDIPSAYYIPTAREVTQHRVHIANSMHVPGVLLWPMGTGNMQVALNDIAKFFGLAEDVSPEIRYSIEADANIEIVVYSTQARVIATVFSGPQSRGSYEVVWNGRDDAGRQAPNGDYVAEVRIGTDRIVRKRITLGGY
jgi:hypothetical protein